MGHSASTPQLTPFMSPSRVPLSHKQALTEDEAHKLLLLECLFKSIDVHNVGWVARQDILDWIRMEPYLQQPTICSEAQRMLNKLNHDEDSSRCSYREFVLAFLAFTTDEVTTFIINLLRSASTASPAIISSLALATSTSSISHESERAASYSDLSDDKNSRTLFLLHTIFIAMDSDQDEMINIDEFNHWFTSDPFFEQQVEVKEQIDRTFESLGNNNGLLSIWQFLTIFASLARRHVKLLLIHLLHRTTNTVVKKAKLERKKSIVLHHRDHSSIDSTAIAGAATITTGTDSTTIPTSSSSSSSLSLSNTSVPSLDTVTIQNENVLQAEAELGGQEQQDEALSVPTPPIHLPLLRRHSILACGAKRTASSHGLRLTLLGQSMIQHDLRETQRGQDTIRQLASSLYGDVIFSELETAIQTPDMMNIHPTRNTVFFHSASPTVIDCLQEMNMNLLGLSSNHTGDLAEAGVYAMIDEMKKRNITYAGIGCNLREASSPAYLDTANGRIALVSFASKVPIGSDATDDRAGVNAIWMEDIDSQKLRRKDVAKIIDSITCAKIDPNGNISDIILVYHHNHYWEKSNVNEESKMGSWKRKLAHKIIDAGANIYISHGDPRLQGIEIYNGCPIFYCLGNWIFQTKTEVGFYGSEVWESVIVQIHAHTNTNIDTDNDSDKQNNNNQNDDQDSHEDEPIASYSVKLIPVILNEVGDGYADDHEHAVKGCRVTDEKQREHELLNVATSPISLPSSPSDAAVIAATSAALAAVPVFLSPPAFSLNNSPRNSQIQTNTNNTNTTNTAHIYHNNTNNDTTNNSNNNSSSNISYMSPPSLSSSSSLAPTNNIINNPASLSVPSSTIPPPSPLSATSTSFYNLHLATRGLPRFAPRYKARAILKRLQKMSEEWDTIIEIDDPYDDDDHHDHHQDHDTNKDSDKDIDRNEHKTDEELDREYPGGVGVVGWVSTKRPEDLSAHPFIRNRASRINTTSPNTNMSNNTIRAQQQTYHGITPSNLKKLDNIRSPNLPIDHRTLPVNG